MSEELYHKAQLDALQAMGGMRTSGAGALQNGLRAVETRSIEDSLVHGHDAMGRAERLARLLADDLNGASPEVDTGETYYGGIVSSADRLAGRAESLCRDLERIRQRIVASSPATVGSAIGSGGNRAG